MEEKNVRRKIRTWMFACFESVRVAQDLLDAKALVKSFVYLAALAELEPDKHIEVEIKLLENEFHIKNAEVKVETTYPKCLKKLSDYQQGRVHEMAERGNFTDGDIEEMKAKMGLTETELEETTQYFRAEIWNSDTVSSKIVDVHAKEYLTIDAAEQLCNCSHCNTEQLLTATAMIIGTLEKSGGSWRVRFKCFVCSKLSWAVLLNWGKSGSITFFYTTPLGKKKVVNMVSMIPNTTKVYQTSFLGSLRNFVVRLNEEGKLMNPTKSSFALRHMEFLDQFACFIIPAWNLNPGMDGEGSDRQTQSTTENMNRWIKEHATKRLATDESEDHVMVKLIRALHDMITEAAAIKIGTLERPYDNRSIARRTSEGEEEDAYKLDNVSAVLKVKLRQAKAANFTKSNLKDLLSGFNICPDDWLDNATDPYLEPVVQFIEKILRRRATTTSKKLKEAQDSVEKDAKALNEITPKIYKMKVSDLRQSLELFNLNKAGTKVALQSRLQDYAIKTLGISMVRQLQQQPAQKPKLVPMVHKRKRILKKTTKPVNQPNTTPFGKRRKKRSEHVHRTSPFISGAESPASSRSDIPTPLIPNLEAAGSNRRMSATSSRRRVSGQTERTPIPIHQSQLLAAGPSTCLQPCKFIARKHHLSLHQRNPPSNLDLAEGTKSKNRTGTSRFV